MRRLKLAAGVLLASNFAVTAQGNENLPLNLDISLALNYASHLYDTAPRTTERGGKISLKFGHDDEQFALRSEGRLRWNDAYRNPAYSQDARDAYLLSADWRELYVSSELAKWNMSFGLQQVVWGKADNLRVVDQVNPVDLRDFIVQDLNDYRKPLMMLRGARPVGEWNFEALYIPFFEPTTFARSGSEFDIPLIDPQLLKTVTLLPEKRPSRSLENGEIGIQVSRSFEGFDLNLFMFNTWDDNPVFRQIMQTDALGNNYPALQAGYHRQFMTGISTAYAMDNGLILRTELAHVPNYTYMVNAGSADGLVASATWTGLLGVDYTWRDWQMSVQTSDRYISEWSSDYLVKKHAQLYSFSATGTSLSGKLESRISLVSFVNSEDGYLAQLKTTWKSDDHWAYTLGSDFFEGKNQGVFGQFRDKDRLWFELKYGF